MQTQAITVELQLAGLLVLGVREDAWTVEVAARYEAEEAACPRCGRTTRQVHQWRQQRKQDADLWEKMVYVLLWKRRTVFTADDPGCGSRRRTDLAAPPADGSPGGGDDGAHGRALAPRQRGARAAQLAGGP